MRAMGRALGVGGRTRAPGPVPVPTGVGPGDGRAPTGAGWRSIGLGRSLRRQWRAQPLRLLPCRLPYVLVVCLDAAFLRVAKLGDKVAKNDDLTTKRAPLETTGQGARRKTPGRVSPLAHRSGLCDRRMSSGRHFWPPCGRKTARRPPPWCRIGSCGAGWGGGRLIFMREGHSRGVSARRERRPRTGGRPAGRPPSFRDKCRATPFWNAPTRRRLLRWRRWPAPPARARARTRGRWRPRPRAG